MRIEYSERSLIGHREDNQDRSGIAVGEHAALLVVIDGMGGHAEGALAAETALKSLMNSFKQTPQPLFDPLGFLHLAIGRAHDEVAALGIGAAVETRPRATCAVCLVQQGAAYWAHVGDSRIYLIRNGVVVLRTRDHSHVEQLLREGSITEADVASHPMRNFVECCLGGDLALPEMSLSWRKELKTGDVLLLCSDGLWANLKDAEIGAFYKPDGPPLADALNALAEHAVKSSAPYSDNTTAVVLRWLGEQT